MSEQLNVHVVIILRRKPTGNSLKMPWTQHWISGLVLDHALIWLVVWLPFLIFPLILGLCHHPNWRTHIFQRGGWTTNQLIVCRFFFLFFWHSYGGFLHSYGGSPTRSGDGIRKIPSRNGWFWGVLLLALFQKAPEFRVLFFMKDGDVWCQG